MKYLPAQDKAWQQSSVNMNPSHIIVLTVDTDAMLIAGAWRASSCISMIGTRHRWRWWRWWWWWYADRGWHGCYEVITPGTSWYRAHTWSHPCKLHYEYIFFIVTIYNSKSCQVVVNTEWKHNLFPWIEWKYFIFQYSVLLVVTV